MNVRPFALPVPSAHPPSAPPAPVLAHPLRSALAALRDNPLFHDVDFLVGEERIGAVMAFVAARSKVLERTLYGGFDEGQPAHGDLRRQVKVGDSEPRTFRDILYFLHTDELPPWCQLDEGYNEEGGDHALDFGRMLALYELAERYDVPDLKALLIHRLHRAILFSNPIKLLELVSSEPGEGRGLLSEDLCRALHEAFHAGFGWMIKIPCLLETLDKALELKARMAEREDTTVAHRGVIDLGLEACKSLIRVKGKDLFESLTTENDRWVRMSPIAVKFVLGSQMRQIPEIAVFHALVAWWQHDQENRTAETREVVHTTVCLPLITTTDLASQVEPVELLSDRELKEAYKFAALRTRLVFPDLMCQERLSKDSLEQHGGFDPNFRWKLRLRVQDARLMVSIIRTDRTNLQSRPLHGVEVTIFIGRIQMNHMYQPDEVLAPAGSPPFDAGSMESASGLPVTVTAFVHFS